MTIHEDYKVVKKILGYLGIYEFKRGRPHPKDWQLQILLMTYAQNLIAHSGHDHVDMAAL